MLKKDKGFRIPTDQVIIDGEVLSSPIGDKESPDPYITYDEKYGRYYLLFTRGKEVRIFASDTLSDIRNDEKGVKVYGVEQNNGITGSIWAPEMHKIDDRWYIYTSGARTADGREDRTLFILKSRTDDPLEGFDFAGFPDPQMHAIDPTVIDRGEKGLYMCYAREDRGNRIWIRRMATPLTFEGEGTLICEAELDFEKIPPYVGEHTIVEGPFFVESPDKERLFVIYSANGCWSDDYALGVLELTGEDPLDARSWEKDEEILLKKYEGVYGPGHASFFRGKGGEELYIAYHGMLESNVKVSWAPRFLFVKRVYFDKTGFLWV